MGLLEWFNKGFKVEEYLETMKVNKDEMLSIYNRFHLNDQQLEELSLLKDQALKVIVLTEDWCGDAMLNNPVLLKIAENTGMEVRFLLRDQNLELMDQYLTNGTSRAIPIFIFIDGEGAEKAVWGPRAPELQTMVDELRAKLPDKDAEDFADKQKEMITELTTAYKQDSNLWSVVASSIIGGIRK